MKLRATVAPLKPQKILSIKGPDGSPPVRHICKMYSYGSYKNCSEGVRPIKLSCLSIYFIETHAEMEVEHRDLGEACLLKLEYYSSTSISHIAQ